MKNVLLKFLIINALLIIYSCSSEPERFEKPNQNNKQDFNKMSSPTQSDRVAIGSQVWMRKNLNVTRYRNGDLIPHVQDQQEWDNLTTGAWCYAANETANGIVYGKLYNWYAVNDERGLAPNGWHIPSHAEFFALRDYLGMSTAAKKMRSITLWIDDNGDNSSNFTALPGGFRYTSHFGGLGTNAIFWTSTESSENYAWSRLLIRNSNAISNLMSGLKTDGYSVRCIKN